MAPPKLKTTSAAANPAPPAGRPRAIIRIPKTAEVVAANIRKMIIRGQVKAGDYLQPEAALMEHFGTSRPTIREAFRILENEQLVTVTRGSRSGARIHAPSVAGVARYAGFALQAQGTLLSDIYLARLAIEPYAVRLAATRRTKAQLSSLSAEMDRVTDLMEGRGDLTAFRIAVFELHQAIVAVAGSNTLTMMSAMLVAIAEQHMSKFVQRDPVDPEALLKRTRAGMRSFRKLWDLLKDKDADGAEAHWRAHIQNANETWLLDYDQTALVDVLD